MITTQHCDSFINGCWLLWGNLVEPIIIKLENFAGHFYFAFPSLFKAAAVSWPCGDYWWIFMYFSLNKTNLENFAHDFSVFFFTALVRQQLCSDHVESIAIVCHGTSNSLYISAKDDKVSLSCLWQIINPWTNSSFFYPRPVLAFGYCCCLYLCLSVCVSHELIHVITRSSHVQARITKFGPGARFTNNFSITMQMWWKFHFALIQIIIKWSLQYLVHGTTAGLLWHVPNFVAIWSSVIELELNEISIKF